MAVGANELKIRLAGKGDIDRQKEIWKLCFGDSHEYIDFYFANRYSEDETIVLIYDGAIASMLTMIPVRVVRPDGRGIPAAMLYAIATHPEYQGRGLATGIMDFSDRYLVDNHKEMSVLVPAAGGLFEFYKKRGYTYGFSNREVIITGEAVEGLTKGEALPALIAPAAPKVYNHRRNSHLQGSLYVAYEDGDIAYQKLLSKRTGADIYTIDVNGYCGCATVERINAHRLLVKELMMPDFFLNTAVAGIAKLLPAKEYVLRLPAHQGKNLNGTVRPFGMVKLHREPGTGICFDGLGYLGIAYD